MQKEGVVTGATGAHSDLTHFPARAPGQAGGVEGGESGRPGRNKAVMGFAKHLSDGETEKGAGPVMLSPVTGNPREAQVTAPGPVV